MTQNNGNFPLIRRNDLKFGENNAFSLILDVVAHATTDILIKGYTQNGYFTYRLTPLGDGSLETHTFNIEDIPLAISCFIDIEQENSDSAHVTVHLGVSSDRIAMLCQGTVGVLWGLSWPTQHPLVPAQTEGNIDIITDTGGGAGVDIDFELPANEEWEILGVVLLLATSATVANRTITLSFKTGNSFEIRRTAGTAQTASQNQTYSAVPGGTNAVTVANSKQEIGLPQRIKMPAGSNILTSTANLQAGDVLTAKYIIKRTYSPTT